MNVNTYLDDEKTVGRTRLNRFALPVLLLLVCLLGSGLVGTANAQAPAPAIPTAPNDTPVTVVNEIFNEWTINSGLLYWAERCYGGELIYPANLRRQPAGGGTLRAIGATDSNHCLTYLDMAADSSGLYYYSASDARLEFRASGTPDIAVVVYNLTSASLYPTGERLAVDGGYIYWLTSTQLVRVRQDGTDFGVVAAGLATSSESDLLATNGTVYYLDNSGLWETSVSCGTLPCSNRHLSTAAGTHLMYYHQGGKIFQSGARLYWVVGASIHRVSCSDIIITCSETTPYTAPADGNAWTLGRPATDGTNLFWQEGYTGATNPTGNPVGRLRRMPLVGGAAVDIAVNLFYYPGPVYIDAGFVYFTSTTNFIASILKLPLNAGALARDLTASALEITQGIQNLANDAPLAATKTTFVRAYGGEISGPNAPSVDAYLYGTRNGSPLPGSPLSPINGRRALAAGVAYVRVQRDSGWLFQLPASWITAGNISLRLVVDPHGTYTDPNRANNELTNPISFTTRQEVCTIFIPVHTHAPLPSTNIANFWQMIDYTKRLWPTARLRPYHQDEALEELEVCTWHGIPYPCFGPYELPSDTWKVFTSIGARDLFTDDPSGCNVHYIGMVDPATDTGATTGTGMTSVFNYAWVKFSNDIAAAGDPFAPRSGETLAHEMGHNQGRQHVDCGSPDDPDPYYPYPTNQIANFLINDRNHEYYGFDVKSLKPIAPDAAKDFMSYCTPKWTSDYTWRALFGSLAFGPDAVLRQAPGAGSLSSPNLAAATSTVLISGAVTPTASAGQLGYAWNFSTVALSAQTLEKWQRLSAQAKVGTTPAALQTQLPQAIYHVRLLDAAGAVLADQTVTPVAPHIHEGPSPVQVFFTAFPAPAGTVAKVELLQDVTVLDSRKPGTSVPTVSILKPAGGETVGAQLELSWQAQDADPGDILHYTIQYSPDNGQTWRALATDVTGLPGVTTLDLTLPISGVPGSQPNGARIRVAASDGYHTGLAVSNAFTVSARKPEPFIINPLVGETTPVTQSAILRGAALDAQDGSLSGAALTWTVDGQPAGSGEQTTVAGLAPGDHPVVLTARNSLTQTATAQATLTILPLSAPLSAAPALDGMCDDASYANASQMLLKPYNDGTQAGVQLLQDGNALWVCFTGLISGTVSPGTFAGVRIDVDHSRDALAQTADYGFFVGQDGGVSTAAGDGSGGFANPGPGGLQARVIAAGSLWSAELRIDAASLGGLNHVVGLSAGQYQVSAANDDYPWPYASLSNSPKTWATTALATLPAILQLKPGGATAGDLGVTLVISGQNFISGTQALWNGAVLPTTFGGSGLLTATVSATRTVTAGMFPIVARNPVGVDSAPAPFPVNNPPAAISALLPGSVLSEGATFTLQVNGGSFMSGAKVLWNGQELPTTRLSATQLTAQVDAGLIASGGAASISVLNPAPGGGASPGVSFTVLPNNKALAKYKLHIPSVQR